MSAYTDEENTFLREVIPGRTHPEISALFEARFGRPLSPAQVSSRCRTLGVRRGKGGVRGNVGGSRSVPVGAERLTHNGYVEVKVSMSRTGNPNGRYRNHNQACWRLKHHLVWEREHGEPVPLDCAVVFADGDKRNFDPANLVAVPKGVLFVMNVCGMQYYDAESLQACIAMARIRMALKRKKREKKDERA